jgi:hypothetical protein
MSPAAGQDYLHGLVLDRLLGIGAEDLSHAPGRAVSLLPLNLPAVEPLCIEQVAMPSRVSPLSNPSQCSLLTKAEAF